MHVTIMRGVSGAGKTQWAQENRPLAVRCSASDYFVTDGEYRFDKRRLHESHNDCMRRVITALIAGHDVVVDNTSTSQLEVAPYIAVAESFGAYVRVVTVWCSPAKAAARSVHGTPLETCQQQDARLEQSCRKWPRFWPEQIDVLN